MEIEKVKFIRRISKMSLLSEFIPSEDVRYFIGCQFALESDFGRSRRAVLHSNLSGMRVPFKRYSVHCGSADGYACYSDWYECCKDYVLWIFYNRPSQFTFHSVQNYCIFLRNSGYCPEKDYISKILDIYYQFINSKN